MITRREYIISIISVVYCIIVLSQKRPNCTLAKSIFQEPKIIAHLFRCFFGRPSTFSLKINFTID